MQIILLLFWYFCFLSYLKKKNYPASIARHDAFRSYKQVLEGKTKIARMDSKGKVPNRARNLSGAEENILWESEQLGCNSSWPLTQTVWWNNCLHFRIRCREEHHRLKIEQFCLEIEENGRRYISYTEGLRKTRNKGLNCKPRLIFPKMYMNKTERCPLAFFLFFKSKRRVEFRSMGPFYLTVIDAPLIDVLYKNQAMEVNTINKMLSRMKKKWPLEELSANKKVTNNSERKTTVRKLKSFKFPKCETKNIIGHCSERGLDAFDSGNEDEMLAMSSAISKCKYSTSTVAQKKLSRHHHRINLNLISPGLFIQHPLTTTTFLSEYIGITSHNLN